MDLTPAQWLAVLGTGGLGYIVSAVISAFKDRAALKQAKPRVDVSALAESLTAQGVTVDRLALENQRLHNRVSNYTTRIEAQDERIDLLEKQIDQCEHLCDVAMRFINHLIAMWPSKTVPIPRVPVALREHIDPPEPKELNP